RCDSSFAEDRRALLHSPESPHPPEFPDFPDSPAHSRLDTTGLRQVRRSSTGLPFADSLTCCKGGEMTKLAEVVDATAIRPFQLNIPEAELTDLRRRITATRFPDKETVSDFSQGVPLETVQKLARYWATDYDWRRIEARINSVPNFIT